MLCMVQGDLTVLTFNHAFIASRTGFLAAIAFIITSKYTVINNKWSNAWLTGMLTMVADIIVHPTHFGSQWVEAACTGLGAAILCYVLEREVKNGSNDT